MDSGKHSTYDQSSLKRLWSSDFSSVLEWLGQVREKRIREPPQCLCLSALTFLVVVPFKVSSHLKRARRGIHLSTAGPVSRVVFAMERSGPNGMLIPWPHSDRSQVYRASVRIQPHPAFGDRDTSCHLQSIHPPKYDKIKFQKSAPKIHF